MAIKVVDQKITEDYAIYNADTCEAIKAIPSNSCGFSISSFPFRSLYTYSNLLEDVGNCSGKQFDKHIDFLVPEMLRIIKPGRNISLHCMNLPTSKARDGVIGLDDFRGDLIKAFEKHGAIFHSEVCIWKDPVVSMQRTKALGLLHKQVKKDTAMSRQGIPDYLITMRKPGINADPIKREYGFTYYAGTNPPNCDDDIWETIDNKGTRLRPLGYRQIQMQNGSWPRSNPFPDGSDAAVVWSIAVWQRYASPVWMDIDQADTLQSVKCENDIRHICPLQLQAVERAIHMWSNPDDIVFTPFLGISTEVHEAVRLGRKGIGIELKASYFEKAKRNMDKLNSKMKEKNLLDNIQNDSEKAK